MSRRPMRIPGPFAEDISDKSGEKTILQDLGLDMSSLALPQKFGLPVGQILEHKDLAGLLFGCDELRSTTARRLGTRIWGNTAVIDSVEVPSVSKIDFEAFRKSQNEQGTFIAMIDSYPYANLIWIAPRLHLWLSIHRHIDRGEWDGTSEIDFLIVGPDAEAVRQAYAQFLKCLDKQRDTSISRGHVLCMSDGQLYLEEFTLRPFQIAAGSYQSEIYQGLEHIHTCLPSKDPCGRVCILEGPPGVGKSYAVRQLISQLKDVAYVVVPSYLTKNLGDVEALNQAFSILYPKPVCLVIEDADPFLVAEQSSTISDLLNLGDGLLSEFVDLRFILTTNLKRSQLNAALTRDGRLCSHLAFGPLPAIQANALYQEMTGKVGEFPLGTDVPLSAVYRAVRGRTGKRKAATAGHGTYL